MENISQYEILVATMVFLLVRILKILVNKGCVASRGTAKIPVADSYSVFFITFERQKLDVAMKFKKHYEHKFQVLEYKNKSVELSHLFVIQRDQ